MAGMDHISMSGMQDAGHGRERMPDHFDRDVAALAGVTPEGGRVAAVHGSSAREWRWPSRMPG
jgi:hypothetical protein